ncbi:hypothetical protein HXX76_002979 [Chlamydomonas incerta]|uniref:Uncharacterized protein n=1 Tax=Chlamydomonas incerta TaxID=51695 RepID=A0A835W9B3_CHLIN|nr:hypothetical protein HXX76_002979 [Chlamydomonas incerta]|eukprot:KAG2442903.1 hypothetical protein HXX76_002979 [Chlamydomonas incerta]
MLFFPDTIKAEDLEDEEEDAAAKGPQLPKVRITSRPDELRRAFNVAERMGQQEGAKARAAAAASEASAPTSPTSSTEQ